MRVQKKAGCKGQPAVCIVARLVVHSPLGSGKGCCALIQLQSPLISVLSDGFTHVLASDEAVDRIAGDPSLGNGTQRLLAVEYSYVWKLTELSDRYKTKVGVCQPILAPKSR